MEDNQTSVAPAAEVKGPKAVTLSISKILELLKAGTKREAMPEIFGVNKATITEAFKHPKLKGRKVHGTTRTAPAGSRKKYALELVDDTEGTPEVATEVEETAPTEVAPKIQSEETTNAVAEPVKSDSPSW